MQALMERVALRPVSSIQVKPRWRLDPDLVLYLPFWNMPDGTTYLSQDAYGHTCTRYGVTPTGQGGWSFDGSDDYVDAGNAASLDITTYLTMEQWIKLSVSQTGKTIVGRYSVDNAYVVGIDDGSANKIKFYTNGGAGGTNTLTSPNAYDDGLWHHVVATYDGSNKRMYVDGVEVISVAYAGSLEVTGAFNLQIGRLTGGGQYFNGLIGEVRIYNRVLTEDEVLAHFNATKGLFGGG